MRKPLVRHERRKSGVMLLQSCPVHGLVCSETARRLNEAVDAAIEVYRRQVLAENVNKIRKLADAMPVDELDIRTTDEDK